MSKKRKKGAGESVPSNLVTFDNDRLDFNLPNDPEQEFFFNILEGLPPVTKKRRLIEGVFSRMPVTPKLYSANVRTWIGGRMIDTSFKDALSQAGLHTRDKIIADGTLRRFQVEGDKPRSLNGWYVLFDDGCPSGAFGNWKTGAKHKWHSKGFNNLTEAEKAQHNKQIRDAREKREAEDKRIKAEAAKRANKIWNEAIDCPDTHSYLVSKNVKAHGIKLSGNKLIIPMRDINGTLHSIQTIDEHGNKRFLGGGRKKGCFLTLGSPHSTLNIAEGYSTSATLYEVTGIPTAVSFDAGNLIHVAKAWRSRYPALEITICADNDSQNAINTGVTKAREAALAIGGLVAIPPRYGCDFNDYYNGKNK